MSKRRNLESSLCRASSRVLSRNAVIPVLVIERLVGPQVPRTRRDSLSRMSDSGSGLKVTCEGASSDLALKELLEECLRLANVSRSSLSTFTTAIASSLHAGEALPAAKSESTKLPIVESVGSSSCIEAAGCDVKASTGWVELLAETQAAAASSDAMAVVVLMLSCTNMRKK